jgi:hypothetical protein
MTTNSARIGAAAFALGLSLAGPHATATADSTGDSPAVSAAGEAAQQKADESWTP